MKKLVMAATLVLASIGQAETIKCNFTEPFVSTVYDSSKETLTITGLEMKKEKVKKVSMRIQLGGIIELVDRDGAVLQEISIVEKGSDGMSDIVFPLSARGKNGLAADGYGGCESDALKADRSSEQ